MGGAPPPPRPPLGDGEDAAKCPALPGEGDSGIATPATTASPFLALAPLSRSLSTTTQACYFFYDETTHRRRRCRLRGRGRWRPSRQKQSPSLKFPNARAPLVCRCDLAGAPLFSAISFFARIFEQTQGTPPPLPSLLLPSELFTKGKKKLKARGCNFPRFDSSSFKRSNAKALCGNASRPSSRH